MDLTGVQLVLTTNGSELRYAWPRAGGAFVFHHVPAGAHLLDVVCKDLVFPQVRLDISERFQGRTLASYADNPTRVRLLPGQGCRDKPLCQAEPERPKRACERAEALSAAAHPAAGARRVL